MGSSIDRCVNGSVRQSSPTKKTTVYTRTVFRHEKCQVVSAAEELQERQLSKLVDSRSSEKEDFKEKSVLLNDMVVSDVLAQAQALDKEKCVTTFDMDPVQTFSSLFLAAGNVVLASEDKALLANEHAMNQHIDVQRV